METIFWLQLVQYGDLLLFFVKLIVDVIFWDFGVLVRQKNN